MIEDFIVGAYWGAREESLESCAGRAVRWLGRLREIDPAFATWFRGGNSREQALSRPVQPDQAAVAKLLEKSRRRSGNPDPAAVPETGLTFGLWNSGGDGESVGFSISCGAYSKWVGNACFIELPRGGKPADRLLRVPVLRELVAAAVECWEPDQAVVVSHQLRQTLGLRAGGMKAGWITYLPPTSLRQVSMTDLPPL